jgi:hypothetical protein
MFKIEKYTQEKESEWNNFVSMSKNGTFLFDRKYMDYHSDRFVDFSIMIYRKDNLYALLPAHVIDHTIYTHQGLTFGGYIMNSKTTATGMLETVQCVNSYFQQMDITKIVYKPVPFIYHTIPSQEDLYALYRYCKINIIGCTVASTIFQKNKLKYDKSRKYGVSKSSRLGLRVVDSNNFAAFWEILQNNLENKYGARPVHTLDEIELLWSRFPENIKLYLVQKGDRFVGGSVIYINKQTVHAQYASASPEGKESGALDMLFDYLINEKYADYTYFDFGHSNEQMGNYLNENLISQKEGFGARSIINSIYELAI